MASKAIKGITVEIGGNTTKLDKALKSSEDRSKELQTQLTEVNNALKFNPDNVELLTQKQAMLTERIEETTNELDILKNAQEQVQKQFENNEIGIDQYRAFQREIIATESKINTFNGQLEECTSTLSRLQNETGDTVSEFDKLSSTIDDQETELKQLAEEYTNVVLSQGKSSDEAKELASRISVLNSDLQANKERMNDAQGEAKQLASALDDAGQGAEDSGDGFTIMGGALADLVSSAIQGAISAIGNLIGSLFELSEATEEYRQMQAKLEGSANSFGYSMDFANEKYKEFYTYVGDDQMATNAITNLMGLGLETENLEGLVDGAIATWSAYGDSIPIESLTESIAETVNVSKVTGTLADTINWATLSNDKWTQILGKGSEAQKAFNKATKDGEAIEDAFSSALGATSSAQERSNLVARLLNATYGDSKATYDELAGSIIEMNEAELRLKETQAKLGESMSPVNVAIMNLKTSLLEGLVPAFQTLSDLINGQISFSEFVTKINIMIQDSIIALGNAIPMFITKGLDFVVNLTGGFSQGFPVLMAKILEMIQNVATWLSDNFPMIIQKGYEMLSNFIQGIINAIPILIAKVPTIISTFANIINENFPTIVAKGAQLLWQFITGILSAIPTLIANIPKIVKAIIDVILAYNWLNLGKNIITFFGNGIKSMVGFIKSSAGDIFKTVVNALKNLPQTLWNLAKSAISKMGQGITNTTGTISGAIKGVYNAIVNGVKSIPSKMLSIGKDIVRGIWNGITGMGDWLMGKIKGFADGIVGGIKDFFGIHSPSRVFRDEVGRYLAQGIGVGIEENADDPIHAMETLGDDMLNTARGINGITLNRQLDTTFTSATPQPGESVIELVKLVSEYFPKLIEASKHAIVLDSGTLVGETINQMDEQMALLYELKARGV